MDLGDILTPEQIKPDLQASNRWEAIDELINRLVECSRIKPENRDAIVAVVKKRESSMSTGIGFGIAIPHAAVDGLDTLVAVLGLAPAGIPFQSLDGQPARILVALTIPRAQKLLHIKTLAEIARLLTRAEVRERLLRCERADEVVRALRELDQGSPR